MNQTTTIEHPLNGHPLRLLDGDEPIAKVKIKKAQELTINVIANGAKGMMVFDLERPETVAPSPDIVELPSRNPRRIPAPPHNGRTPLPHAIELDGNDGAVFVLEGLYEGDCIKVAKALKAGKVRVEIAGTLAATPENCATYSEALGMQVTPHPVWGVPSLVSS